MNQRIGELLSDWFEGSDQSAMAEDDNVVREATGEVAASLLVHGLLTDIGRRENDQDAGRISAVMHRIDAESGMLTNTKSASVETKTRRFAILTSALTIAAAVLMMFAIFGPHQTVSAAMASLEKVVEAAAKPFDRTYKVNVVEEYPRDKRPQNLTQEAWDREAKKQLDGATLYVRGADRYVMTVTLKSGEQRTSGSDGVQSWAFRENGPVRTSTDLSRFRGGVPGQQQDIPFFDVHALLSQLRTGYDVELGDEQRKLGVQESLVQLVGVRKSRDVRGPKQVEIWFDPDSGTVHEMLLDGLPRGGGGPKSVMLKLIDQSDLPVDFFSHESHHEPEREVIDD